MFLFGHNMAETQTVLWTRVLDRLAGPNPPRVVCVDPRLTEVTRRADVRLAVRPGTNLALMLLKTPHPPAGATTLIVSPGILSQPSELLAMAGGDRAGHGCRVGAKQRTARER